MQIDCVYRGPNCREDACRLNGRRLTRRAFGPSGRPVWLLRGEELGPITTTFLEVLYQRVRYDES